MYLVCTLQGRYYCFTPCRDKNKQGSLFLKLIHWTRNNSRYSTVLQSIYNFPCRISNSVKMKASFILFILCWTLLAAHNWIFQIKIALDITLIFNGTRARAIIAGFNFPFYNLEQFLIVDLSPSRPTSRTTPGPSWLSGKRWWSPLTVHYSALWSVLKAGEPSRPSSTAAGWRRRSLTATPSV